MKNLFIRKPALALVCASVLLVVLFSALALPAPGAVFANNHQPPVGPPASAQNTAPPQSSIRTVDDIFRVIKNLFNIFFWLLIVLAAIFIIYAAFIYLTASGEPEKIKKANRMVTYAVVAVVVATLARAIPSVICNFVSGSGSCQVDEGTGLPVAQ